MRDCCDPKRGAGKCLVFFFTIAFGLGVIISTSSPNWIGFTADSLTRENESREVAWGPFYGQYRTCTTQEDGSAKCGKWKMKTVDLSDCEVIDNSNVEGDLRTLCNHVATWRSTGIMCMILMLIGGGLVFAASCCQMVTCGCCGNSLICISNVLFGIEVVLSIVTWSFAIASLKLIETGPSVTSTEYQWGFWLFLISGTIIGGLATWMADWAAEDSCLRGILRCITCHSYRESRGNKDDRGEPLIGGNSA